MIREFQDNDAEECCQIAIEDWNAAIRGSYTDIAAERFISRYTPDQFSRSARLNRTYVVEDDGKVLAFASLREGETLVEVKLFFVRLSSGYQGVGTELLNFLFSRYHDKPFWVKSTRDAVGFYRKQGFEVAFEVENGFWMERT